MKVDLENVLNVINTYRVSRVVLPQGEVDAEDVITWFEEFYGLHLKYKLEAEFKPKPYKFFGEWLKDKKGTKI